MALLQVSLSIQINQLGKKLTVSSGVLAMQICIEVRLLLTAYDTGTLRSKTSSVVSC